MDVLGGDDEWAQLEGIVEIVPCFEDHFMVVLAFGDGEEGVFDQEVEESFEARLEFLENVIEFDGVHEVVDFFIIHWLPIQR